jgi:pSer/pThr/pTyr-binding forkhead associated (FHA) protein
MIQFRILSGKKAGSDYVARRFPVRIGRSPESELRLEEDGVWDRHAQLDMERTQGFVLSTSPDALATVNGQPARQTVLRNGDEVALGAAKMQFWLSEPRQHGLRFREGLTWLAIAAVSLGQVALIYWLVR